MLSILTLCYSAALYPAPRDDPAQPPLEIAFKRFCAPPADRDIFDPRTQTIHIHFFAGELGERIGQASEFELAQVSNRLPKALAFRLTGLPDEPNQPLRLHVGEERFLLDPVRHDKTLFHVERRDDATQIEFTQKGLALLKPGARFRFLEMAW